MRINAREIARGLRLEGVQNRGRNAILASRTWSDLQESLDCGSRGDVGGIQPGDFSLRDLAANTIFSRNGDPVGHEFVQNYFDPGSGPSSDGDRSSLTSDGSGGSGSGGSGSGR